MSDEPENEDSDVYCYSYLQPDTITLTPIKILKIIIFQSRLEENSATNWFSLAAYMVLMRSVGINWKNMRVQDMSTPHLLHLVNNWVHIGNRVIL